MPPEYHKRALLSSHSSTAYVSSSASSHRPSPLTSNSLKQPRIGGDSLLIGTTASATSVLSHQLSFLQKYVKYLKNIYANKKTPVYDKDHSLLQVKAKSFINIALVHKDSEKCSVKDDLLMERLHGHIDAIQKRKTKLVFSDVCKCKDGSLARNVLVEGAPGVGKTTFAFEFCKQWARGEIAQEWEIVVIIKLRDQRARTAETLNDLLYYPDPDVERKIVDELIDRNGEGMLLILDGYDELSNSQRHFKSAIQKLMSRELLCQASLMVTSRPLATRTLHHSEFHRSIDQHIEVLGFTEKNIGEYINSACADKPELVSDFNSYLSSHPFSSSLMFNPLHCAIVTDLYRSHWERGNKGFAPKTLTELYTGLVHTLLLRYLTHHPVHKDRDWMIQDLSDLPEDVYQRFEAVTKLAAEGIQGQQYVFDDKVPSDTLGLMQREEEMIAGIGRSSSHYFLHLTLQEFFAAISYSEKPDVLQDLFLSQYGPFSLKSFLKNYGKKKEEIDNFPFATHWPVALFIAGKTKLSGVPAHFLQAGLHYNRHEHITHINVALLHLLYETQRPELIKSTLAPESGYVSAKGQTALDWFVIGYCIANSTSAWRVKKLAKTKLHHLHKLVMSLDAAAKTDGVGGRIVSLHIADDSWSKVFKIIVWLQPHVSNVIEMKLVGQKPKLPFRRAAGNRKSIAEVQVLPMDYQALEKLEVHYAGTSFLSFIVSIGSQQQNNLQSILLDTCNFSSKATASLIDSLRSPHCRLRELTLEECTISISDDTDSHKVQLKLQNAKKVSLTIISSSVAISHILLKPHFYSDKLTEMILCVKSVYPLSSAALKIIPHYPMLESLEISGETEYSSCPLSPSIFNCSFKQTLHTLTLKCCMFSSEVTSVFLHFIQSPLYPLHTLTLDNCSVYIPDDPTSYSLTLRLQNTEKVSLSITGSSQVISHMLSQYHFYGSKLTEMTILLSFHSEVTPVPLEIVTTRYPVLETLKITAYSNRIFISPSVFCFNSSNLCILSFKKIIFSDEAISSLICYLQSPNCRLHTLTLSDCEYPHCYGEKFTLNLSLPHSKNCTLAFAGSNHFMSCLLPQLHFIAQSLTELDISLNENEVTIDVAPSHYTMAASFKLTGRTIYMISLSPSFLNFSSQPNRLHTLSFSECYFSDEAINMLMHSLQSHHCRLQLLRLDECTIPDTDCQNGEKITTFRLHFLRNSILHIEGSCRLTLYILSKFHFITKTLTELKLKCADLDTRLRRLAKYSGIKTTDEDTITYPLSPSIFDFISEQNNLHTLSLSEHIFSTETTDALVRFLQSSHCKICKLTLFKCTIPAPNHTYLTRAIISSTTIKHLLFQNCHLYELASGLKQNKTMEELAICDYFVSGEDQFQVFIEAVDKSTVKKLWLNKRYKTELASQPLSRKDVKIEWYKLDRYGVFPIEKWYGDLVVKFTGDTCKF